MKTLFSLIMIFCFLSLKAQRKDDIIHQIENEIKSKNIIRKDFRKDTSWNGGFENVEVYLKNKIPVLIEKTEKQVIHQYLTNGDEIDEATIISAKFYIINWKKNQYVRVGNIHYLGDQHNPKTESITTMKEDFIFDYQKSEIESLIKLKN